MIEKYLKQARTIARSREEVLCTAHLYLSVLDESQCPFVGKETLLEAIYLQCSQMSYEERKKKLPQEKHSMIKELYTYEEKKALESFQRWKQEPRNEQAFHAPDTVLLWLLEGDYPTDRTQENCRFHFNEQQFSTAHLRAYRKESSLRAQLGFGEELDWNWLQREPEQRLHGREKHLQTHLELFSQVARRSQHYLLEGRRGSGKTVFCRQLLREALGRWHASYDEQLKQTQFAWFQFTDFIGIDDEVSKRFEILYEYLQNHPHVIPVFDNVEQLLNPALSSHQTFLQYFASYLYTKGRTFFMICERDFANQSDLLQNAAIQRNPLRTLEHEDCKPIVLERLDRALSGAAIPLALEETPECFATKLLQLGKEHYPELSFPRLAIDLCQSAVDRAVSRVLFDTNLQAKTNEESEWFLTLDDLRTHISEDLDLNPELLGQTPEQFYGQLRKTLKSAVIGQEHVIDVICDELLANSLAPAQKEPRGRFLFIGPPGVGKTEMGRALARELGLGEDAFFIFNMSEFSTEGARTRFMGSDPGYTGYGATRTIYDCVRSRPSCVILLDEVDRSHSSIQDILLSILEGQGNDADGKRVYFSQAIFIMTTNVGQEQVYSCYTGAREGLLSSWEAQGSLQEQNTFRIQLGREYDDQYWRKLLLENVLDESEERMQTFLQDQLRVIRAQFTNEQVEQLDESRVQNIQSIQDYLHLQQLSQHMATGRRRNQLDRALLDRIDCIFPFFPIKEPHLLGQILDLMAKKLGVSELSEEVREEILQEAVAQKESVRPLQRLLKRYRRKQYSTT